MTTRAAQATARMTSRRVRPRFFTGSGAAAPGIFSLAFMNGVPHSFSPGAGQGFFSGSALLPALFR